MRLPLLFAKRYFSSRKSLSVINIISRVSSFAIGIPVAAMVILLSVFNGFGALVEDIYDYADSDITITPAKGKVFVADSLDRAALLALDDVEGVSLVLEENVLLDYRGRRQIARLRGVDEDYTQVMPMESLIVDGEYELLFGEREMAVVGRGLAGELGVNTAFYNPIMVYTPRRGAVSALLPMSALKSGALVPSGVFALEDGIDGSLVLCRLEFMQRLLDYDARATSAEIKVSSGTDVEKVLERCAEVVGDDYVLQTRYQKNAAVYRIMKYEKWGVFLIIFLVMIIASFSMVGALVMLIIDKRENIKTIITMGADVDFVRRIFVNEGMIIGMTGAAAGLVLGVAISMLQEHFGFVKINAQSFLVDAYPVVLQWGDVLGVAVAVIAVNFIITTFTVAKMVPKSTITL
ncbi:MAG: ABC transporter permease [Tidjanibacter sp.]|nr:ABC transporter permease [Tidjanibacter sp.]